MKILFYYVIFPGFLFTAAVGMLASWIDRKVTARIHWRVGPPLLQPLYDFIKLLSKEIIIPKGAARWTFLLSPVFGMAAIVLVSTMLWLAMLEPDNAFSGDLIVILYLLVIPSIAVIVGGFASKNPLASLGASREMKLIMAYELPFILAVFTPVIKADYAIRMGELLSFQLDNGIIFLRYPSCIIAFIVAIMCMQAKLTLVPFDAPEAETEIMAGAYIEYSGAPLGIYKLTRMMMLFTVPMFLVITFMGGIIFEGWHILWGILKYVALLVIIILIRNTSPRVRIDQAVKFFWKYMTVLAIVGVCLAFLGR